MSDILLRCKYCNNDISLLAIDSDSCVYKCYKCRPLIGPTTYTVGEQRDIISISFVYRSKSHDYIIFLNPLANSTTIFRIGVTADSLVYSCHQLLPLTPYNIDEKLPIYLTFL